MLECVGGITKDHIIREKAVAFRFVAAKKTTLRGESQLAKREIMQSVILTNPISLILWILAYFFGVLAVRQKNGSVVFAFATGALVITSVTVGLVYGCALYELCAALLGMFVLLTLTREVSE